MEMKWKYWCAEFGSLSRCPQEYQITNVTLSIVHLFLIILSVPSSNDLNSPSPYHLIGRILKFVFGTTGLNHIPHKLAHHFLLTITLPWFVVLTISHVLDNSLSTGLKFSPLLLIPLLLVLVLCVAMLLDLISLMLVHTCVDFSVVHQHFSGGLEARITVTWDHPFSKNKTYGNRVTGRVRDTQYSRAETW